MSTVQCRIIIISLFFLTACNYTSHKADQNVSRKDTNRFPNIFEVKILGDTTRIEIEKKGDTLIKHYIDLKGLKDDNFDDSYDVVCIYERRNVDSNIIVDKKPVKIRALLTENYQTDFSKGRNFYFITLSGDTIFSHQWLEYIR